MLKNIKFRIVLCSMLLILSLYLLYSNILLLDDFHPPAWNEFHETAADTPSVPENDNQEEKNSIVKKGFHIHINLDTCLMYVYKDGTLLKTYPVSGGKKSTPSPVGTWKIISKDTWGEGFGGAWLGFNVPWGKYGIHGTIYPGLIGSNSSKGCIRMKNKDVRELYKLVPHGTTVTIVHSAAPFRAMKSGDVGSDVLELQKALKKLGYYNGSADGRFGSGLKQSIIKFQKANKIRVTGVAGTQTWEAIKQKLSEHEKNMQ
ncbi:MAG: L,D-transpeptidase family protein [Clostridia bacterium]|nr:L,D-transpeptidase family protein [Clostridia bacterium]